MPPSPRSNCSPRRGRSPTTEFKVFRCPIVPDQLSDITLPPTLDKRACLLSLSGVGGLLAVSRTVASYDRQHVHLGPNRRLASPRAGGFSGVTVAYLRPTRLTTPLPMHRHLVADAGLLKQARHRSPLESDAGRENRCGTATGVTSSAA